MLHHPKKLEEESVWPRKGYKHYIVISSHSFPFTLSACLVDFVGRTFTGG